MLIDPDFKPRTDSLLGHQQFQLAYVTTDLAQAVKQFQTLYGIAQFDYTMDFPSAQGGLFDVALAWAGNTNIEIIQGKGNRQSLYERSLPETGFALQFHHVGYLIPDRPSWAALEAKIAAEKRIVAFAGSVDDLEWIYLEAPELGHYLEYILPGEAGHDLLMKKSPFF